ncbi:EAL domain-containing protein [Sinimarinibacterium sp. CAU 1509]|uniref:EAL domain-containing response regulator n=1 Tax=Sinimarinibacterium sp. CAU 1509 TaxID=2562283 RepID=UPI0010AD5BCC|nr:EAL domain-containing protein [Sinimarinibacterium sp. CAU 1509]TJY61087.1 EAL domain-containing protein [Sinimarinibacterium sp. CAU 1509]
MVDSADHIETSGTAGAIQSSVVLVVAASESVAKRIESYLRNAGHPIRCAWLTDLEDTDEALRGGAADLLICAENLSSASVRDVIELAGRLSPDLPVLVLNQDFTTEETVAALAAGARDQVSDEDLRHLRHLELVVLREFAMHRQLRELRSVRQRLDAFESRHRELVAGTNDAVAHIQEGIVAQVNPAFAQLLGYKPDELIALPLMDLVIADHHPKVKEHLKLLQRGKNDGKPLECSLQHRDGHRIAISARLSLSQIDGEQLIEMLIRADAGSPNVSDAAQPKWNGRLEFFEGLAASIAGAGQQKGQRAALLFIVDDFSGVETRMGLHDAEQAVEQSLDWIKTQLSSSDLLFRFSTHEIAAIVTRPNIGDIQQLGERVVSEVGRQIFNTSGHEGHLSLTVAAYPFSGSEESGALVAELVRDARKLSASGGKRFANLGPTAKSSLEEREGARKAAMVKKALDDNRLKLAYQSIASLEGDTRQHFDVLVRVIDENGKELHASEFIQAAEKFGLMKAIDRWVTARAFKVQAKRDNAQEASSLFIKISQDTLRDAEAFAEWVGEQVKERPLRPGELVFEFQEVVLQSHVRKAKQLTQALIGHGAQIAIEHFGVGSNSAQIIEHIPMQFLKFHHSFTANFNDKVTSQKMTELMEQAKQKGIKIIVSHVEDANVMARLWQMGVNFIQGYHVQEPEVVLLSADVRG